MPLVELMVLGLIISGFLTFIVVLLSVSLYVSPGEKMEHVSTVVTPARRARASGAASEPMSHVQTAAH